MGEGYARVSGKPGVVLVTSGPGATNTVTPLQDALMDGTPLIVFSGQVPTTAVGTDAFQEADVVGITRPCTKWNVCVKDVRELPRRLNEAFFIATEGRPGPVVVDLPKDVTSSVLRQPVTVSPRLASYQLKNDKVPTYAAPEILEEAARLINNAKNPVIFCGQGVISSESSHLLRELANRAQIPVTTTLQGLGAFDELSPLSLHMVGLHGSGYANNAVQNADVVIGLGARFDDRVTGRIPGFAPAARKAAQEGRGGIIHFEINPGNIEKVVPAHVAVEGDLNKNLEALLPMIKQNRHTEWLETIAEWKKMYPFSYYQDPSPSALPKPQLVMERLDLMTRSFGDKVIFTTGVGQHQMWAAQHYRWRYPRSWFTSGGLGTMGFGVPSAIGAQLGAPDKIIIDIDGDASFVMTAMELLTAAQYNIPIKIVVLNNEFQGMVKQVQDMFYSRRGYDHSRMINPNFQALAESMGVQGLKCSRLDELDKSLEQLLAAKGPVVLEVLIEKDERVYPMVKVGKDLHDMYFFEPKTA
eukprot:TRINITY_DN8594_c0_g1_i1.p1 TRINITY_DN8594_c0_g1~~TRINITY_DN8594_c0_g1_i1.p1  ORF type:complete len:617 (-),score=124.24 TRINITY_DN8594_c0_g1_i1:247-1827(-)